MVNLAKYKKQRRGTCWTLNALPTVSEDSLKRLQSAANAGDNDEEEEDEVLDCVESISLQAQCGVP